MERNETLVDLRKFILNSNFWANSWAIATIEKEFNIKVLIFSEQSWNTEDIDNVVNCGHYIENYDHDTRCKHCKLSLLDRKLEELGKLPEDVMMNIIEEHQKVGSNEHLWEDPKNTKKIINPNGFLMVTYSGDHYRLISYKKKTFFRSVKELPEKVYTLFKDKCTKIGQGSYNRISGFK